MTPTEIRNTVRALQAQRHSLREISRILALSRNTVRRILRQPDRSVAETAACDEATLARLKAAFERARGNVVRVQELLADDGLDVRYSTSDPLGQGGWAAYPAAARRRIRLRARTGDAARHVAASCGPRQSGDGRQGRYRPVRRLWCWLTRAGCSFNTTRASPASRPRRSCSRRRAS